MSYILGVCPSVVETALSRRILRFRLSSSESRKRPEELFFTFFNVYEFSGISLCNFDSVQLWNLAEHLPHLIRGLHRFVRANCVSATSSLRKSARGSSLQLVLRRVNSTATSSFLGL